MDEIKNVHYMHAWPLGSSGISFSCHIVVADQLVSETQLVSERIQHALFHKYGIDHPVLQFETEACGNCEKLEHELMSLIAETGVEGDIEHVRNLKEISR